MPGDTIAIRNKIVHRNGSAVDDTEYTQRVDPGIIDGTTSPRDNFGPVTVPKDSYFVLGDNRDQGRDSRFWGYVRRDKITGLVTWIYWSRAGDESLLGRVRWERVGKAIS